MLKFYSANIRGANTEKTVSECIKSAFEENVPEDVLAVMVYATLGHKLEKVNAALHTLLQGIHVFGAS